MKKVVVVVEGKPIVFTGKDLHVSNTSNGILYVSDREVKNNKGSPKQCGVFHKWDYWRELGENENKPFTSRVILKPKGGASREIVTNLYKQLKDSQVVFVPSTIQVIVLKPNGEVKVV